MINLEREHIPAAKSACEKSRAFAEQDSYLRGVEASKIILAEILAREGQSESAKNMLKDSLDGFSKLGIEEGLNFEFAGRICRLLGDLPASNHYLRIGIKLAQDFPLYQAGLFFELGKTLLAGFDRIEATVFLEKAADLYLICEAPLRAEKVKKHHKNSRLI